MADWLTGWGLKYNRAAFDKKEEETHEAFFAVSALWIEGNPSGLPLCDTKNLAHVDPSLAFCLPPLSP